MRLKAAGLGSLPGGGAEILVDRVRNEISPRQGHDRRLARRLPRVARAGRARFGHHDVRPRGDVGRADRTSGTIAPVAGRDGRIYRLYLLDVSARTTRTWPICRRPARSSTCKTQAVSRLYLDNFANLQSSWVTQGLKIGQLALLFRGQRHGQPDDRRERRGRGRHVHFLHDRGEIRDAIPKPAISPVSEMSFTS